MGQKWGSCGEYAQARESHQAEGHEPGNQVLRAETGWLIQLGLHHREDFSSFGVYGNYRGLHLQKSRKYCRLVTRKHSFLCAPCSKLVIISKEEKS